VETSRDDHPSVESVKRMTYMQKNNFVSDDFLFGADIEVD